MSRYLTLVAKAKDNNKTRSTCSLKSNDTLDVYFLFSSTTSSCAFVS